MQPVSKKPRAPQLRTMECYEKEKQIGEGSYGKVYLAHDKNSKAKVAIKQIHMHPKEGYPKTGVREHRILTLVGTHPNVVKLLEVATSEDKLIIDSESLAESQEKIKNLEKKLSIFQQNSTKKHSNSEKNKDEFANFEQKLEIVDDLSLERQKQTPLLHFNYIFEFMDYDLRAIFKLEQLVQEEIPEKKQLFSKAQLKSIARQILSGLAFLHKNNILHRDIKPGNILINRQGFVKIGDYGLARLKPEEDGILSNYVITKWYRPPELLYGDTKYSFSADIWSIGCLFFELFSKNHRVLFKGDDDMGVLSMIYDVCGTPDKAGWEDFDKIPSAKSIVPKKSKQNCFKETFKGEFDEDVLDFLSNFLILDPKKRITAEKSLLHPFFTSNSPLPCEISQTCTNIPLQQCHDYHIKSNPKEVLEEIKKNYEKEAKDIQEAKEKLEKEAKIKNFLRKEEPDPQKSTNFPPITLPPQQKPSNFQKILERSASPNVISFPNDIPVPPPPPAIDFSSSRDTRRGFNRSRSRSRRKSRSRSRSRTRSRSSHRSSEVSRSKRSRRHSSHRSSPPPPSSSSSSKSHKHGHHSSSSSRKHHSRSRSRSRDRWRKRSRSRSRTRSRSSSPTHFRKRKHSDHYEDDSSDHSPETQHSHKRRRFS